MRELTIAQNVQRGVPASGKSHDCKYWSNDITSILQGLLKQFNLELKQVDQEEFDKVVAYDENRCDLANEKKFKSKEKSEKETC